MNLSVVIPVYNSENILEELVLQISRNTAFAVSFELVFVNDHSHDGSWEKIAELFKKYNFIKGINLRKNAGQHNAIMAGLNHACGDVIIIMDDDLQHSPEYLEKMYMQVRNGNDVCYAKFKNRKHASWKIIGSKFNDLVANILLDKPKDLYLSSFKAISKEIRDEIIRYKGTYPYIDGLILSLTDNISTINVKHFERYTGKGNYSLGRSLSLWLKMVTGFSVLPLRLATLLGLGFSLISFLFGSFYFFFKIFAGGLPRGWTTLIVVIFFLGGIQLLSIGIIGEYVGRSYLRLNDKRQFIVGEVLKRDG